MLLNYPSLRVTFPSHTSACQATYNNSPRLSGVDCERDMLALRKLIYADFFNTDPDMYFLWDSAVFSNPDIESLMGFHVNGGGNHTGMYDSACAWLKLEESKERWKKWLKIEPCAGLDPPQLWDPASRRCVSGGASQAGTINVKVIAIAIAVLVAVLLAGVWVSCRPLPCPIRAVLAGPSSINSALSPSDLSSPGGQAAEATPKGWRGRDPRDNRHSGKHEPVGCLSQRGAVPPIRAALLLTLLPEGCD